MRFECRAFAEIDEDLWSACETLRGDQPAYRSPFFDTAFARIVGEARPDAHLALAWNGAELVAFWPLHRRPGAWARPIGAPFCDWHAPVVRQGHDLDAAEMLGGCRLAGMTVSGYQAVPGEPCRTGERVGASMADLSRGFDAFLERQRAQYPKQFKKMRRMRRNLERNHDDVVIVFDDHNKASFRQLLALKRAQFRNTGKHDVLAAGWVQRMMERLWTARDPEFRSCMVSLYIDGRFAAGEFNLCSRDIMHGWITAYEQDFAYYSPGFVVLEAALRDMPAHGLSLYDAGCGHNHYKKYYATHMLPLDQGVLTAKPARRPGPTRAAGALWRAAERLLPHQAGAAFTSARRRGDQILSADLGLAARLRGAYQALETQRAS